MKLKYHKTPIHATPERMWIQRKKNNNPASENNAHSMIDSLLGDFYCGVKVRIFGVFGGPLSGHSRGGHEADTPLPGGFHGLYIRHQKPHPEIAMPHTLKPLPYPVDALEPHYDGATLEIHHGKHHQAYVDNLNKAIEGYPDLQAKSLEDLLKNLGGVPEKMRVKVANNAGGAWNHDFFWQGMGPVKPGNGGAPTGNIADALDAVFGGFDAFRAKFKESALDLFGSGWTFLVAGPDGGIEIQNFADQDSPVRTGVKPLLTLDVWEHAYYLKFQNRRADWVDSWWNVVDWDVVATRHAG
jgi:Fe-Mn family superoxide dismutase